MRLCGKGPAENIREQVCWSGCCLCGKNIVSLLNHTQETLNELTGKYYDPIEFIDYKADVERPLLMIYQCGYLTIKDCDLRKNACLLDFPNNEVKKGFVAMVVNDYLNSPSSSNSWTLDVVDALENARPYEADPRKLFKVGAVFSSETGTISDFKLME